eukprot:scaffold162245_cov23-Cyclotella_meneghiniana.AAC.1
MMNQSGFCEPLVALDLGQQPPPPNHGGGRHHTPTFHNVTRKTTIAKTDVSLTGCSVGPVDCASIVALSSQRLPNVPWLGPRADLLDLRPEGQGPWRPT